MSTFVQLYVTERKRWSVINFCAPYACMSVLYTDGSGDGHYVADSYAAA